MMTADMESRCRRCVRGHSVSFDPGDRIAAMTHNSPWMALTIRAELPGGTGGPFRTPVRRQAQRPPTAQVSQVGSSEWSGASNAVEIGSRLLADELDHLHLPQTIGHLLRQLSPDAH